MVGPISILLKLSQLPFDVEPIWMEKLISRIIRSVALLVNQL